MSIFKTCDQSLALMFLAAFCHELTVEIRFYISENQQGNLSKIQSTNEVMHRISGLMSVILENNAIEENRAYFVDIVEQVRSSIPKSAFDRVVKVLSDQK